MHNIPQEHSNATLRNCLQRQMYSRMIAPELKIAQLNFELNNVAMQGSCAKGKRYAHVFETACTLIRINLSCPVMSTSTRRWLLRNGAQCAAARTITALQRCVASSPRCCASPASVQRQLAHQVATPVTGTAPWTQHWTLNYRHWMATLCGMPASTHHRH